MKKITLKDVKIQKTVQTNFTFSSINIDESDTIIFNNKTYTNKDFAHKLEVNFYPTVLFLDSKNEIVYKARGFRSTEKFQHILNFMITNAFEEMSFFEYLENIKKGKGDKE
ncbi:thioredoxin family protein [Arcobacter sp. 15-2]|uniref:thioredoxin family protein n=1 Tax=Arcobacter sp. 15-2 TaxID=3374109 RepID=UPI00399D2F3A